MSLITRRAVLAAAGSLATTVLLRKPLAAEELGGMSELRLTEPPVRPPDIAFVAADESEHRLSDFLGHGMVINFWATWCAPCVAELPALSALARALAPDDIAVMPLSSDRGGAAVVTGFFARHGITGLPVLLDPKGAAGRSWGVDGIPTTVVIDKQGRERARLQGAADWASPQAAARIRALVNA